jgi:hypothetical protein
VHGQEEAWQQIEARVFQETPARYRPSLRVLIASVAAVIVLVVFAYSPLGDAWVTRHLGVYISTVSESARNLILHEAPSSGHKGIVGPLLPKVDFQPLIISPGTKSWSLQDAVLQEQGGGDHILVLAYTDAQDCTYTLYQSGLDSSRTTGLFYDADDATLSTHSIRGTTVHVLRFKDGSWKANWSEANFSLTLESDASREALLEFIHALVQYQPN